MKHWMQTFTGRKFSPLTFTSKDVDIVDIAHALSMMCRYNGHCKQFYSVAQHSVLVSENCIYPLQGLLHDADEAYLIDMPKPIKNYMESIGITAFKELENLVMGQIALRFGITLPLPPEVKQADILLAATEARDLMAPLAEGWRVQEANGYPVLSDKIEPWCPDVARTKFLNRFAQLRGF